MYLIDPKSIESNIKSWPMILHKWKSFWRARKQLAEWNRGTQMEKKYLPSLYSSDRR